MTKTSLGILFIAGGVAYGSLAIDKVNDLTMGNLVRYNLIRTPSRSQKKQIRAIEKSSYGRKGTILFFATILVALGIFLLITPNV